ncbi:hypothetical protein C4J81_04525 [Deltaproteobacteria bacterium Smac51]|nr:hypothetical protein C4J81_04525 [Deltaproteobacteria bacterium Smac51]
MKNDDLIRQIIDSHNRPLYLYSRKIMEDQADILLNNFSGFDFLYSIKTNPFPPVVRFAASRGFGADAASAAEVDLALAAGMAPANIFYSTPGKTKADLESSLGKAHIIADSLHELELLDQLAAEKRMTVPAGLRVNPDFSLSGGPGVSGKFGIDLEIIYEQRDFLQSLKNITIEGLHIHLRSQVLNSQALAGYYAAIFDLAVSLKRDFGWNLGYINFGGGLGIVYSASEDQPLDIPFLSGECTSLWAKYKDELKARLMIETGRFLVGKAGDYHTPIVDIKVSRGRKYLVVRSGLNGFMRPSIAALMAGSGVNGPLTKSAEPLFTSARAFEVSIVGKSGGGTETVDIVGSLCTATDILALDIDLPQAAIGDIIRVGNAGSYAYTLSPLLFSSHQPPMQIFMNSPDNLIME